MSASVSNLNTPLSATLTVSGTGIGNALMDILMASDIWPGAEPSYQVCKTIYSYHPLGMKMCDAPIKMAQSQPRLIVIPDAPDEVQKKFEEEWAEINADQHIAEHGSTARRYGISSLIVAGEQKDPAQQLDTEKLADRAIYFTIADPLNTSGSLVLNQDPNAPDFMKVTDVRIQGQLYHRSRACVLMNERPIYIEWTTSAFGFVGRSVYQRALYPLKSFVQSMITDDMVTRKAGVLIEKLKQAGSIVNNVMQMVAGIKRSILKQAATNNVISVGHEDSIETLNMQNLDRAAGFARTNILKNIATSADMPAVMLENETLVSGFGEGSEDAKIIAGYVEGIRTWLQPAYAFMDGIVQRRAWNKAFYEIIARKYPELYEGVSYEAAYQEWCNKFTASWPSLLREPESELVKVEDVKCKTLIASVQVLLPVLDPDNKATALQWFEDNMADMKLLFPSPLRLDYDKLRDYVPPASELGQDTGQEPKASRPFAATA